MVKLRAADTAAMAITELMDRRTAFAIVDACDTPSMLDRSAQYGPQKAQSLFHGEPTEGFAAIAPHLFALEENVLRWLHGALWNEPWGIFVNAECGFEALRHHFRRFTIVRSPSGEALFFRFYDPRVLATYLEACSAEDLLQFFGPVSAFAVCHPDNLEFIRWYFLEEEQNCLGTD